MGCGVAKAWLEHNSTEKAIPTVFKIMIGLQSLPSDFNSEPIDVIQTIRQTLQMPARQATWQRTLHRTQPG
jgi:hypothetical protein